MTEKFCVVSLEKDAHQKDYGAFYRRLKDNNIEYTDIPGFSADDCSEKALSSAMSGNTAVLCIPTEKYLEVKYSLFKAYPGKTVRSNRILNAIGRDSGMPDKEKDLMAAVPENSKLFVMPNGKYSAFAFRYAEGMVIMLPSDYQYQSCVCTLGLDTLMNSLAKKKYSTSDVKECLAKVIASDRTIAVANAGYSKAFLAVINSCENSEDVFIADQSDCSACMAKDNAMAFCAKQAKEKTESDYGVSISSIESDDGDTSVTVCVATSEFARMAVVHAVDGEEPKELLAAAIMKLCEMVSDISKVKPEKFGPLVTKNKVKKSAVVTIVGILTALLVCFAIAFAVFGRDYFSKRTEEGTTAALLKSEETTAEMWDPEEFYEWMMGGNEIEDADTELLELAEEQTEEETKSTLTEKISAITTTIKAVAESTSKESKTTVTTKAVTTTKVVATTKTATTKAATTKLATTKAPTTKAATTKAETSKATTKASTTKEVTTKAPATEIKTEEVTRSSGGVFKFTVYGYGHGVGMSQEGAMAMARSGSSYEEILTHYFPGTKVKTDSSTPSTVKYGGNSYNVLEYLCRTVDAEIGMSAPVEALKAQACTAYTYAKYYGFNVASSKHAFRSTSYAYNDRYSGKNIEKACMNVLGMSSTKDTPRASYLDYNGTAAQTYYFASSAGKTASAHSVWGSSMTISYLQGGINSPETVSKTEKTFTVDEMEKLIKSYAKSVGKEIKLGNNPADWITIIEHDGAVNSNTGYITKIQVGNYEMRGYTFRCDLMSGKIRSHCFTVEYMA